MAIIVYGDQHILPWFKAVLIATIFPIKRTVSRLDNNFSNTSNSVSGIDTRIGKDLVDLRQIYPNQP
jgi:hypothetical protein